MNLRFVYSPEVAEIIGREIDRRVEAALEPLLAEVERLRADAADPWMDSVKAAAYLGITDIAIRARARRGTIPGHKDNGAWFFHRDELDAAIRGSIATIPGVITRNGPSGAPTPPGPTPKEHFDAT